MPDFFGYTDPFNKAGQALGPQRAAPPANAARPRSLFDDPALQQMLAKMPGRSFGDVGPTTALPGEMQSLAAPGESPLNKAMGGEGQLLPPPGGPQAMPAPGGWSMAELAGTDIAAPAAQPGAAQRSPAQSPPAPGMADYAKQLNDIMSQPVSLGQEFVAPHKWSVGPARRMGETDVQAGQREETDYQGRLGAAQQAQQAQQFGTTAALSGKAQQMNTLSDLMKAQIDKLPTDIQRQHLGLEERKQKFIEGEAARLKGDQPRRTAMEDKMIADAMGKPGGITPVEMAEIKKKVSAAFPENNPPAVGQTQAGVQPQGSGGDINAIVSRLPLGVTTLGETSKTPEEFATKLYQLDRSGSLQKGTSIQDLLAYMNQKFTPKLVDDYLRNPSVLGVPTEGFSNAWDAAFGTGKGTSPEADARSAFRNALRLGDTAEQSGDRLTATSGVGRYIPAIAAGRAIGGLFK